MRGIDNIKAAAGFLLLATTTARSATADGNIGIGDVMGFIGIARKAKDAIEAAKNTPAEFADMDPDEAAELVEFVAEQLGLPISEKTTKVAETVLAMVPDLMQLFDALREAKAE